MMKKKMKMMNIKNNIFEDTLGIVGATFNDNLFHITVQKSIESPIPMVIEYSKHCNRHFIFYNCQIVPERKKNRQLGQKKYSIQSIPLPDSFKTTVDIYIDYISHSDENIYPDYHYTISYEKKFTSKDIYDTISKYKSYIREKKINEIL